MGKIPSATLQAFKMFSLLKYQIEIMPKVCFVSLSYALGTKKHVGHNSYIRYQLIQYQQKNQ